MTTYSVHIETDAPGEPLTVKELDRLADAVHDVCGGITSGSRPGRAGYAITVTVVAPEPGAAYRSAARSLSKAVDAAGVPPAEVSAVEILAAQEQERRLGEPAYPRLMGVSEVADKLGVSRQRASELQKHPDFPRPLQVLRSGPVWPEGWLDRFVETWPRRRGRPPPKSRD